MNTTREVNGTAQASVLIPQTGQAIDFLSRMYPEDTRHLVAISYTGRIKAASFSVDETVAMEKWIEDRQGKANLYFHVNSLRPGLQGVKAKKNDIVAAPFLHVDIDDLNALGLMAFEPKPTAVVFSGGGRQAFWRLDKPSSVLEFVERCNRALAKSLGGDNCHSVDHIMRLPGSINILNAKKRKAGRIPAVAYVVEEMTDWSRAYDLGQFAQASPTAPNIDADKPTKGTEPVDIEAVSVPISESTRALIINGDDPERPIGSVDARYPSRSEVVYRVTCDLVRAGATQAEIVGIFINPKYGISASVREKRRPSSYAARQVTAAKQAVGNEWPDIYQNGKTRPTLRNTMLAIRRLGLYAEFDEFRQRKRLGGQALQLYAYELTDDACAVLRNLIINTFDFDPGKDHTREAAITLCLENTFHPVRDYLKPLKWDGIPRLGSWLSTYLGAENNELNQAIGRIMMVAAVRRILLPGVKFDTIVVLEGLQGSGKSTALRILAGDDKFSDQDILTLDAKAQAEAMAGIWIYELCELEGLGRADINKVKAFASRAVDRARPAYGRFREDRPRQNIFVGTTNDDKYLKDPTGNRRFWPVRTGKIDLEALARDRDQLWAEAAYWEGKDESIVLSEELWPAAAREQEARLEDDSWLDVLADLSGDEVGGYERIASSKLLTIHLEVTADKQQPLSFQTLGAGHAEIGVGRSTTSQDEGWEDKTRIPAQVRKGRRWLKSRTR